MKKYIFTTLVLLISLGHAFSQVETEQLLIDYNLYFVGYSGKVIVTTLTDDKHSLQTIQRNINVQSEPGVVENITENSYIYKDYIQQSMILEEFPSITLSEKLNNMTWELTGRSKKILNYACDEAKTTFRGRNYIAYFTTNLPFKSAPWKFHGLPGVMLEVYSTDKKVKMTVNTLKQGKNLGKIKNPFRKKKRISWEDFKKKYEIQQKNMIQMLNSSKTGSGTVFYTDRIDKITEMDKDRDLTYDYVIQRYWKN